MCCSAQSCTAASCRFSHSAPDGKTALFDFSSVCQQAVEGEFNPNITGFPYSFQVLPAIGLAVFFLLVCARKVVFIFCRQICGGFESPVYCNPPDWVPVFSRGVVVDQWDAAARVADSGANNCTDGCTGPGCCTTPCEVLAVGLPLWSVMDSANPSTGGVYASFAMVPRRAPTVTECKVGICVQLPRLSLRLSNNR